MSRLSRENDRVSGEEAVEPHSTLAVQAARAATILLSIAFLIPRAIGRPVAIVRMRDTIALEQIVEFSKHLLSYAAILLALSSVVGTIVSLMQSRLRSRWWSEVRLGYHREQLPAIRVLWLVLPGVTIVGLWSFSFWISVVSRYLGIGGEMHDLLVALRVWLLSLGGGCGFISVGAAVLAYRPWRGDRSFE